MEKIIIFGATGTIGEQVVEQSLMANKQLTAFCRNKEKIEASKRKKLNIIEGDVFDAEGVAAAIKGHDVVIITLGSGKSRTGTVRSEGTKNIMDGMKKHGVKRLICQTTLGAGDSHSTLNFFWKYIMFGWFLKQVFLDHELQERLVQESGLDWTIVRPAAFTDGERTSQYKHGFASDDRSISLKISRADVADFILKQVDSSAYFFKTPGLSY